MIYINNPIVITPISTQPITHINNLIVTQILIELIIYIDNNPKVITQLLIETITYIDHAIVITRLLIVIHPGISTKIVLNT
jgi:hypothetical protein